MPAVWEATGLVFAERAAAGALFLAFWEGAGSVPAERAAAGAPDLRIATILPAARSEAASVPAPLLTAAGAGGTSELFRDILCIIIPKFDLCCIVIIAPSQFFGG